MEKIKETVKEITIDGEIIRNREDLFNFIRAQLDEPMLIGSNLDALHDCLTSTSQKITIKILNPHFLAEGLGDYWNRVLRALGDAAEENPAIEVSVG